MWKLFKGKKNQKSSFPQCEVKCKMEIRPG